MTFVTKSEMISHHSTHEKCAMILEVFVAHANRINDARRRQYREEHSNRIHFTLPNIIDDLSFAAWYMDSPTKVFIPEAWGSDGLDLPVEVLTGEVTAEAYVAHLWIEFEKKQREQEESSKERKLNELKRYAEQYPQEAAQIIANINLGV